MPQRRSMAQSRQKQKLAGSNQNYGRYLLPNGQPMQSTAPTSHRPSKFHHDSAQNPPTTNKKRVIATHIECQN